MIDFITLVKSGLSDREISTIVEINHLQTNSKDGVVYYDNISTKNFVQDKGIFIRIETNQKLKLEGSLHKFYNEISGRERNNYNLFSMSAAKRTINTLLASKNICPENLRVYNYEIGLNLDVSKDCRFFLDKMKSIGPIGNKKKLWNNPRFKNERMKVTEFPVSARKYFKVYDKIFESIDRKRKIIPEGNILRIETVYKRLDNCYVIDFFNPDNLLKMVESFFRDWRTIQFEQDIITPKGTGRARQYLCLQILEYGKDIVLTQAKEKYKSGSLKDWEYRNIREFINNEWDVIKREIKFVQSDEEKEFRQLMRVNYTLLKNDEFINLK